MKLDLIEGNTLFVDGTKMRANAGIKQTRDKETWEKILKHVDERIDKILQECEEVDSEESGNLVKMSEELNDQ